MFTSLANPEHWVPLVVVGPAIVAVLALAQLRPGPWILTGAKVLAIGTLLAEFCWWGAAIVEHRWYLKYNLPLHLCEFGSFLLAGALWSRRRLLVEISYFWGVGGTLQGLFTPDIPSHFPYFVYFQYYVEHGFIVLGAFYLVIAMRIFPAPGAVLRVSTFTAAYAVVVGLVDYVTGGNYLFLRRIPSTGTLFDYLGPWPWYIVSCTILAVLIFTLLYLPFRSSNRRLVDLAHAR